MASLHQHTGLPAQPPVDFELDGDTYTLPNLPTRLWLDALPRQSPACWWQLIPAQLPAEQAEHVFTRLLDRDDPLDLDDLEDAAETVLAAVAGVEFHAANRLAGLAHTQWFLFDGYCSTVGFRPLHEPISSVLAAVYAWRRSACQKEAEAAQLDAMLWAPPETTVTRRPRNPVPSSWSDEREAAMFESAMSMLGRG